jgi:hypothetical protein
MIKMSKFHISSLLLILFLCFQVQAQTIITRIAKLEVDGKEVKKDYKALLYSEKHKLEAKKNNSGFILPDELRSEEYLGVIITFGKHKLDFSRIHISNFGLVWTVGVDKKPYSEEFVEPEEAKAIKQVYYIKFTGGKGLDRTTVVTIRLD